MKVWVEENKDGRFIIKYRRLLGFTKTYGKIHQMNYGKKYREFWSTCDHLIAKRQAEKLATQ